MLKTMSKYTGLEIAIIGMACRLPEAKNWREYWTNLVNERESIHHYSTQELLDLGYSNDFINRKNYVKAEGNIADKDQFDAAFFRYTPNEASFLNPVHRLFHECAWEAIEDAGINLEKTSGLTGVYGSVSSDLAWPVYSMLRNRENLIDDLTLGTLTGKESMPTLFAYKFDLKGASQFIDSSCSSSLSAINTACKNLLLGDIDIALVGSVTIENKDQVGYIYDEYSIWSSDGHCRTFDKDANGTVASEGAAVIILKRLKDAIKDGDNIYCVVKGSATNNDGKRKIGYAAPSVYGQAECILKALKFSRVEAERISYVETHGTATRLGDSIEISALKIAYNNLAANSCCLGSVKTNIGHTRATSGIAALIKVALSLKTKIIPATLNYHEPNPELDSKESPFFVNAKTKKWERKGDLPLCAGLNSFGVGGTNVHIILEEYMPSVNEEHPPSPTYRILPLSAKTRSALIRYASRIHEFVAGQRDLDLEKVAYTLQTGRTEFPFREAIIFKDRQDLLNQLSKIEHHSESITKTNSSPPDVMFHVSGTDVDAINRAVDLYKQVSIGRIEPGAANDLYYFLNVLAGSWKQGVAVNWHRLYEDRAMSKISLPTYAFDHVSFPTGISMAALFAQYTASNHISIGIPKVNGVKQFHAEDVAVDGSLAGIEKEIEAIFKDFFGIADITPDTDFFDLGGDSLKAVMLVNDLGNKFDLELSPPFLFEYPTIKELALEINQLCLSKIVKLNN